MLRALRRGVLASSLLSVAAETGFPRCSCDASDALWSAENILQCQKYSDFLIAAAYFSITLELLYFVTCSSLFPFKWIIFQFGAFIVLCGLTHLFNVFTYEPHPFAAVLALTVSKFLTALVSFATAITLLTLIPQLLRVKVREDFLRNKTRELNREVGLMKRQEEASWHVRMLTHEIRKSLDRHTILYTTLVELSKALDLRNCAVWMPDEESREMKLTHELRRRSPSEAYDDGLSIPISDPDVLKIKGTKGVTILKPDSVIGRASNGRGGEMGAVAAIRMPLLKASNFKGGTPEVMQALYAILVLVLSTDDSRDWSSQELEIVEVVADQVAVALSHAAVLEESQATRDELAERNRSLLRAKHNAVTANETRKFFHSAMSQGMREPINSILGLLSMMQQENLGPEQRLIVNAMAKTSLVVSTLINDAMGASTINTESFTLEMRPFGLHSMIMEAASVAKFLCDSRGLDFGVRLENAVPNFVMGDEKRIFHVILHLVSCIVNGCDEGSVMFRILSVHDLEDRLDSRWTPWRFNNSSDKYTCVKFEIEIKGSGTGGSSSVTQACRRPNSEEMELGRGFRMCKRIVQMMQGNIGLIPNPEGLLESAILILNFQAVHSSKPNSQSGGSLEHYDSLSSSQFQGLRVLLVEYDSIARAVTRKLLEKLGFCVLSVSSAMQCMSSFGVSGTPFQLVILDLDMPGTNGFELAMRIRKLRSGPFILGMSANTKENGMERCQQSGINGLIRKPVMLQALSDELRRVFQIT